MKKVLILEDNAVTAEQLKRIIGKMDGNIETFYAANYADACKIALRQSVTLFIVDIILNGKNPNDASGLDFIRFLRGTGQYEFAPVIITSGIVDSKLYAYDHLHCYQYLEKPFRMEQVMAVIEQALKIPQREEPDRYIYFRDDETILTQKVDEIVYVYYKNRRLILKSIDGVSVFYYRSLNQVKDQLFSSHFVQCNRHTLVNWKYVWKIDLANSKLKLKGNYGELIIGATYKRKVSEEFVYD